MLFFDLIQLIAQKLGAIDVTDDYITNKLQPAVDAILLG
jgi:hypothetical protein